MSTPAKGIERYLIQFKRTMSLPVLPSAVSELLRVIDSGEASAVDIERIVATDPALFTMIMRVAAGSYPGNPPTSLRLAIMRIGQREIRSMAISFGIKRLIHVDQSSSFDTARYARHSLTVGFLTRYLFARHQKLSSFESAWTADEMFAAGVLHDIGYALLARVAPDDYARTEMLARRLSVSMGEAFQRLYECELQELGSQVAEIWKLPSVFVKTMRHMNAPWQLPEEMLPLAALSYADTLANRFGESLETWPVEWKPLVEAEIEMAVPVEEEARVQPLVLAMVEDLLVPLTQSRAA